MYLKYRELRVGTCMLSWIKYFYVNAKQNDEAGFLN